MCLFLNIKAIRKYSDSHWEWDLQARVWSETYLREQFGCYVRPRQNIASLPCRPLGTVLLCKTNMKPDIVLLSKRRRRVQIWRNKERWKQRNSSVVSTASQDCCKKWFWGTQTRFRDVGACLCSLVSADLEDSLFPNMFTTFSMRVEPMSVRIQV